MEKLNNINDDPFEKALYFTENKLTNFLSSKNHKDSNINVRNIIEDNKYVLSLHKKKKYSNFYENLFLKKNSEEKNYTVKSIYTNDNFSDKNAKHILKIKSNTNKNSYIVNDFISNNDEDEDYLNKKTNEETKKSNSNQCFQDFFKKFSENSYNKSNGTNASNNKIDNNLLLNINSNFNFNNCNDENIFVGIKDILILKKMQEKIMINPKKKIYIKQ